MREKWEATAVRTKAIILAVFALVSIVATVWVIDARYAKAGEFKSLQMEYYHDRIYGQIKEMEDRLAHINCRVPKNLEQCQWLRQRLAYWQAQLRKLEQQK